MKSQNVVYCVTFSIVKLHKHAPGFIYLTSFPLIIERSPSDSVDPASQHLQASAGFVVVSSFVTVLVKHLRSEHIGARVGGIDVAVMRRDDCDITLVPVP